MKRYYLFVLLLGIVLLTGCGQEKSQSTTPTRTSSARSMEAVGVSTIQSTEEAETSETTESKEETKTIESEEKNTENDNIELLQKYGEAYANFKSLNHRNENLKDLMTEECIKMSGIDIETGNGLGSEGKVTAIYQNDKEEYAVLLDCIQNGSPIRILLLAKVEDGKVAEMTYNTLKQEY